MKTVHWFCAVALAVVATPAAWAQEAPKPGPEHEFLKKHVGTWDLTMKVGGMESKAVVTQKMDLGGLWLVSTLESEFGGVKIQGRGMDTYDPARKKFVGVFIDSMSTSPLVTEGTLDKEKKTLTMVGDGPGMDGKPTKYKIVTEWKDDDTVHVSMFMGGGSDQACTGVYKRRK